MRGKVIDVVSSVKVLVYCDLITPQLVGTESVRLLRTIICPTQLGNHLFQNIYYLPVEKKLFQEYASSYGRISVNLLRWRLPLFVQRWY